jgi:hypothetical protein
MTIDWASLLDVIDAGLEASPPVIVDDLPADPGPVPAALVDRAARTLRRMAEVEGALEQHRAEIGRDLAAVAAARSATAAIASPTTPYFLDARA